MARTKHTYICKYCGKTFLACPCRHQKYCSYTCAMVDRIGKPHPHKATRFADPSKKSAKKCPVCGKSFSSYITQNSICCSYTCSGIFRSGVNENKYKIYTCEYCGKEFKTYKSAKRIYCSKKCLAKSKKGKTGKKAPRWNGGKIFNYKGYILVYAPNHPFAVQCGNGTKYIRMHRLIMENKIGRYLKPEEVVHHINGRRADNRISNLRLFANHSEHMFFCKSHKRRT